MKTFTVLGRKLSADVAAALALAVLLIIASFLPLAFRNPSQEFKILSIGERANLFALWNSGSGEVTASSIEKPKDEFADNAFISVNSVLQNIYGAEGTVYKAEKSEFIELAGEDGSMRILHTCGFFRGEMNGYADITIDADTSKILSLSVEGVGSGPNFPGTIDTEHIVKWIENNTEFNCFSVESSADGMSGKASFESSGSMVTTEFTSSYDPMGYFAVSIWCT